jgi:protein-disulfide isomerase
MVAAAAMLASACTSDDATAQGQQPDTSAVAPLPAVLATIGEQQITLADVQARVGTELAQIDVQYRRARDGIVSKAVDGLVRERVLGGEAARRGLTMDQLLAAEAGGKLEPTDAEVAAWFQENQSRLGGRTLAELRPQIVEFLGTQRREQALVALERRLHRERQVVIHFQPSRIALVIDGAPSLGAADAPVTLVEFSDFQCPYCRTFYPRLYQLEREFRGQLRLVFLQFPLTSIHPNAFKAAEASLCAHDQGKFWQLHDQLFEGQQRLAPPQLKELAQKVGLASQTFDSCLDSGKYSARVRSELDQGEKAAVSGTPAIFLNGAFLEGGALPYEALADAVRRELARLER